MGPIQQSLNNILISAGVATAATKGAMESKALKEEKALRIEEEKKKEAEAQAQAKAEAKKAEQEDIAKTNQKLNEALSQAVGYTKEQATAFEAEKALGDVIGEKYNKKPRGVGQKTYDRRTANANTMQVILQKAAQDQAFRERINKFSSKQLAKALKPSIDKKEVKK